VAGFRRLDENEIWRGAVVTVVHGRFEAPDGTTFDRELVRHPGAVSVVPVVGDEVILVRQFRAAIDDVLLEIPAGKRDKKDESPTEVAHRELMEEIGMDAGRLELLARFYNSPGFCDEDSWVYLGTELREVPTDFQGVEEQHMTIERVALADVPALIDSGELRDAKTVIGLTLARERLAGRDELPGVP
jgi:8-oxo-dGTP pyrophosphatase MutT (NUDIX family)